MNRTDPGCTPADHCDLAETPDPAAQHDPARQQERNAQRPDLNPPDGQGHPGLFDPRTPDGSLDANNTPAGKTEGYPDQNAHAVEAAEHAAVETDIRARQDKARSTG